MKHGQRDLGWHCFASLDFDNLMKRSLILATLLLTGCTTTRYVRTPCLSQEQLEQQRQAEPEKIHDKLTGKADEDIRVIAGSNVRLRGYAHGLLDILGGCTG